MNSLILIISIVSIANAIVKHHDWPTQFHDVVEMDSTKTSINPYVVLVKDSANDTVKSYLFSSVVDSVTHSSTADSSGVSGYADSSGANEPIISVGSPNEFWSWDKTWRTITQAYIQGLTDTLANKLCLHCKADSATVADSSSVSGYADIADSAGTANHTNLSNLNSTNYYHLTQANHTDLTDGGNTTLHIHDSRYFTETELTDGSTDLYLNGLQLAGLLDANSGADIEGDVDIAGGLFLSDAGLTLELDDTDGRTFRIKSANKRFDIRDQTAEADRISIDSVGRVGIKTTSPSANFDVNGVVRIRDHIVLNILDTTTSPTSFLVRDGVTDTVKEFEYSIIEDSLSNKIPMVNCYTDDIWYTNAAHGYLISTDIPEGNYTYVELKITGYWNSYPIDIRIALRVNTTSITNYYGYAINPIEGLSPALDTVFLYNDNNVIKFWMKTGNGTTEYLRYELCTDTDRYEFTVQDSAKPSTGPDSYVSACALNGIAYFYGNKIPQDSGYVLLSGENGNDIKHDTLLRVIDDTLNIGPDSNNRLSLSSEGLTFLGDADHTNRNNLCQTWTDTITLLNGTNVTLFTVNGLTDNEMTGGNILYKIQVYDETGGTAQVRVGRATFCAIGTGAATNSSISKDSTYCYVYESGTITDTWSINENATSIDVQLNCTSTMDYKDEFNITFKVDLLDRNSVTKP